jgi:hypothetical protein
MKKSQKFVAFIAARPDKHGNNTCHASRKIGAPRRVFYFGVNG